MSGQDSVIKLRSWKNPKKIVKLHPDENYSFNIAKEKADTLDFFLKRSMTGRVISLDSNILTLKIGYENIILSKNDDGFGPTKTIDYRYWLDSVGYETNLQTRKIDINKIKSVTVDGYHKFSEVGGALVILSGITALFIAPVASVNFKTGLFVKERYFTILGASGGGIVVGLSVMQLLRQTKVFRIKTSKPDKHDDKYYSIGYK